MWRWDGMRWVPVSSSQPLASGPARSRPWIAIAGGASSIVAVILQFSACIFPYAYYSDGSPSIFNGAFAGDAWFIAEPVTVVLGGLIAAILVMIGINRTTGALSAGALVALGVQSTTMWAGYMGIAANQGRVGPGSIIGVVGGALLIAGGSLALTAVVTERLKQAPAEPKSST